MIEKKKKHSHLFCDVKEMLFFLCNNVTEKKGTEEQCDDRPRTQKRSI